MYNLYCDEKYLKNGGRKAISIKLEEFKEIVKKQLGNESEMLSDIYGHGKIFQDISKIEFDLENITCTPGEFLDSGGDLLGFHEINGLPFLGILAGGDWEEPVFFILYYDGRDLRGYIPTAGNVFNKDLKAAFGSDYYEENNPKEMAKTFLRKYSNIGEENIENHVFEDGVSGGELTYNWGWLLRDIQSRIIVNSPELGK